MNNVKARPNEINKQERKMLYFIKIRFIDIEFVANWMR